MTAAAVTIRSLGNEGFRIQTAGACIYVDAFFGPLPGVAGKGCLRPRDVGKADLILVTHAHWDHFVADGVAEAAERSGASVVGPASAIRQLRASLPAEKLVELEPPEAARGQPARTASVKLPAAEVTAFRTFHSQGHNSYLVEMEGFRFFHDGDNEDTRRIEPARLGSIDALMICPWKGSGWVEFIEKLAPRRWLIMHLTEGELDQHARGEFLPDLCHHVPLPERLAALRPGESLVLEPGGEDRP